jgi:tetratricopeptide (TPR) repeat protein
MFPAALAVFAMMFLPALSLAQPEAGKTIVLQPQQEAAIGRMLGVDAPDIYGPCKLRGVSIDFAQVHATYDCEGVGEARFDLLHESADVDAIRKAGGFALVPRTQNAPEELVETIGRRMAETGGSISWNVMSGTKGEMAPGPDEGVQADGGKAGAVSPPPENPLMKEANRLLFTKGQGRKAYPLFLSLAREDPSREALGGFMVSIADSQLSRAEVKQMMKEADAAPDDEVLQLAAAVAVHYHAYSTLTLWPGWREVKKRYYEESIKYLLRTLPKFQDVMRVWIYLAASYDRVGRTAEAEEAIAKALEIRDRAGLGDADALYIRAQIRQRTDPAGAVRDIEQFLESIRDHKPAEGRRSREDLKTLKVHRILAHLKKVEAGKAEADPDWFEGGHIEWYETQYWLSNNYMLVLAVLVFGIGLVVVLRRGRRRRSTPGSGR